MSVLKFIVFNQSGYIRVGNDNIKIAANSLLMTRESIDVCILDECRVINCTMLQLLEVCDGLCDHLPIKTSATNSVLFHRIPISQAVRDTLDFIQLHDPSKALPFIIYLAFIQDWESSSAFFAEIINEGGDLLGFMNEHAYNPWPVEKYADMLGLTTRKFNMVFKARYCISPKRWLCEKRLMYARFLLGSSTISVAEVAWQSGFSNHAYFSDCFRKRFSCAPRQWREKNVLKLILSGEVNGS
ncbi:helix-turn-helix domain-containing protein [Serratia quinivorans]|uniref:helix-turn-helix domain-containing protein n=1 Tax=Serratia quinivorans TaxID=137545 RepID=UPI00217A5749|nr:AraC family transcriptional regulator [Serratia quinivorans]CAI1010169.1 L-rhamnose operon regulatory protein rhaS [Serratia quinivorans]CAI1810582.1 L-rhamnose operon regulatory protein rhaS [Serratia quinivorans]